MMFFGTPPAFWLLLSIPVLVLIYMLRSRAQNLVVSSLLLWLEKQRSRAGGTRIERPHVSWLFFLELLILALLVCAAVTPFLRWSSSKVPLVVVLDDSFSMSAGEPDSPRARAMAMLDELLEGDMYGPYRFILAGSGSRVVSETFAHQSEARRFLEGWTCRAAMVDLERAVGLAGELGAPWYRVLVLTDRPPAFELDSPKIRWRAFGRAIANVAFINAVRSPGETGDRCLLEIANFSETSRPVTLSIEPAMALAGARAITIPANESKTLVFALSEKAGDVRFKLEQDILPLDDSVLLLPPIERDIRVEVTVSDDKLRELVTRALTVSGRVVFTPDEPMLRVIDSAVSETDHGAWVLAVHGDGEAQSFIGPFLIDTNHPLMEGVATAGLIWGAGDRFPASGEAIIGAGNVPLLVDRELPAGDHIIHMNLKLEAANLQNSPNWPILLWNLLEWRASFLPGIQSANAKVGGVNTVLPGLGVARLGYTDPSGRVGERLNPSGPVAIEVNEAGLFEVSLDGRTERFSANNLAADISDLQSCASGEWGGWSSDPSIQRSYRNVAWIFLLAALLALMLHLYLTTKRRGVDLR